MHPNLLNLKAVQKMLCLASMFIFLVAACMHLFYSPHHLNFLYHYPPGPTGVRAQLYFLKSTADQKIPASIFPVDFELSELEDLIKVHRVETHSNIIVSLEPTHQRNYLFLLKDARAPPAAS